MIEKQKILEIPFVYTANAFVIDKKLFVGAGSERDHPAYLIEAGSNNIQKIADGPGGMMSLVPLPGSKNEFYSVMGLFPPFIGADAGIFHHYLSGKVWVTEKVLSLPFAHRCEIIRYNNQNHLFVATVSRFKENTADWSRPGELHHAIIPDNNSGKLETEVLVDNLFRNHGMVKTMINGSEAVCISGASGIFAIQMSDDRSWKIKQLFDKEVSEFAFFDLDDDGQDELVTIEPFHGNSLSLYKKENNNWRKYYSSPLSFGHGLSTGIFKYQRVIVVGNRRDSEALEMHIVKEADKVEKVIIEEHAGPTQVKVFHYEGKDYILSSNQIRNEVVLYS